MTTRIRWLESILPIPTTKPEGEASETQQYPVVDEEGEPMATMG